MGCRWYLGGRDGLQACLPTLCEVAGDFNGVRGAAEVGVHPVGTCSRAGQSCVYQEGAWRGFCRTCTSDSTGLQWGGQLRAGQVDTGYLKAQAGKDAFRVELMCGRVSCPGNAPCATAEMQPLYRADNWALSFSRVFQAQASLKDLPRELGPHSRLLTSATVPGC